MIGMVCTFMKLNNPLACTVNHLGYSVTWQVELTENVHVGRREISDSFTKACHVLVPAHKVRKGGVSRAITSVWRAC